MILPHFHDISEKLTSFIIAISDPTKRTQIRAAFLSFLDRYSIFLYHDGFHLFHYLGNDLTVPVIVFFSASSSSSIPSLSEVFCDEDSVTKRCSLLLLDEKKYILTQVSHIFLSEEQVAIPLCQLMQTVLVIGTLCLDDPEAVTFTNGKRSQLAFFDKMLLLSRIITKRFEKIWIYFHWSGLKLLHFGKTSIAGASANKLSIYTPFKCRTKRSFIFF